MLNFSSKKISLSVFLKQNYQHIFFPFISVHYTAYPFEKLRKMITELASWVWDTTKQPADAKLMAVRKKYEDKKLSKIAGLSDLTGPIMAELKNGAF